MSPRGIHALHAVLGVLAVLFGALVTRRAAPTMFEINVFRLVNQLPPAFAAPLLGIMQFGALPAVGLFAAVAVVGRRRRLARYLLVGGGAAWLVAKILQVAVDQEPPDIVLRHVSLHGSVAPGLAFPSTHVAVAAALATTAAPYLSRPNRRLAWWLVGVVGVARVYVGAHFPIDVIGGVGVGWAVGSLVHLLVGSPGLLPGAKALDAALRDLPPLPDLSPRRGTGPCAVPPEEGPADVDLTGNAQPGQLLLKVVGRDDVGADWLYRAWRLLVFRRDDERQRPRDPRELAEHEAYLLLLARQGGVEVPQLVGTRMIGEEHAVIVREFIDGTPLDELSSDEAGERALVDAWQQLHRLHAAGITSGSPTLDAFVVDGGQKVWVVELAGGATAGDQHRFAHDDAELCVAIAERHSVEIAARCAAAALDHGGLVALLGQLQPLSLSARSRRAARRGRLLIPLRSQLGQLVGAEPAAIASPTRVAVRNLLPLLAALLAVNLLLPQVGHAQATLDALRQARWTWLLALCAAATATYIAAAVSLMGAVGRRLELGRTTAAQLAAAFSNRLAPAGLGGMSTNVMYLRAAGSSRVEAITAVGLNSVAGFLIHLVGVAAIVPLLGAGHARLRFSGPELPDRWPWLLVAVVALAVVGSWHWWAFVRRFVGSALGALLDAMRASLRRPRPTLVLLAGAGGITTAYTLALAAACEAFSVGLPLATVTAVYLGGSAAAAVAPTPGGLGALEAALVAGLTAAGASSGPAIAAVLTYRLVTYWVPVLPGAVSFHVLRRSGWL